MRAIESEPKYDKASAFLSDLGFFLIKENQTKDAENIFQYISSSNPHKCYIGYIGLGLAYGKERNYLKAIVNYDKAIPEENDSLFTLNNRGMAFAALGTLANYTKALHDYDEAILQDNSSHACLWNNKGNVLYELGRLEKRIRAGTMSPTKLSKTLPIWTQTIHMPGMAKEMSM